MESRAPGALAVWSAPECPFTIEYSTRALDEIRLAVVDAFFSLPRGGAEIGGILLGNHQDGGLVISDYVALDCEHALGPSFTLSAADLARLAELLASAERNPSDLRPVGWYHSHTRSEIFLSDADQEIHRRYFPAVWQVALVLKPHAFEPTRCGFFFREAGGSIRATASYQEFALDPLPMIHVSGGAAPRPASRLRREPEPRGPAISISSEPAPPPPVEAFLAPPQPGTEYPAAVETARPPAAVEDLPAPKFAQVHPVRSWRWLGVPVAVSIGLALGAAGFQTRPLWLPRLTDAIRGIAGGPGAPNAANIGLNAVDSDGQLQIHWDHGAAAVRAGTSAILQITDGSPIPRGVRLDAAQLRAGVFTYARQSERVDVALIVDQPHGPQVREVTSFLGKLPDRNTAAGDATLRRERDQLAAQAAKLKSDLNAQIARNQSLEKRLAQMQIDLQRQRLGNQSRDPIK